MPLKPLRPRQSLRSLQSRKSLQCLLRSRQSLRYLQCLHQPVMSVVSYLGIGTAASVATTISIGEDFAMANLAPSRAVSPGMPALSPEIGTALVAI